MFLSVGMVRVTNVLFPFVFNGRHDAAASRMLLLDYLLADWIVVTG